MRVTNTNGRLQATIECEKGSPADLNRSLPDLQASLAKHNITLVGANAVQATSGAGQFASNNQNGRSNPEANSQGGWQQAFSQGNDKKRNPGGTDGIFGAEDSASSAVKTKSKNQKTKSRTDGWEQWA